ncbi:MAG: TraB/GumN family protein [Thermoplasmatota archaeon]
MIILIGTGHVFNLSQQLLEIFNKEKPEIICVELDKQRYDALILKQTDSQKYKKQEKNIPILYKLLSKFQESMAKQYGVTAGSEMITAINYAQTNQIPVAFIDLNAQNMFTHMLKKMSLKEKFSLVLSGIGGIFVGKKRVEEELKNFEKKFDLYIEEIGKKYPTIKKILIDERNNYMTEELLKANMQYKKIIAVVGDGHIPGLSILLSEKKIDFKTIRLSQIKDKKTLNQDSSTATFSVEYKQP